MHVSRRKFLQHGSTVAAAAAVANSLPQQLWADPLGLPIGIQLYTVGAEMQKDVPGTLKQISEIGYKVVETAGFDNLTAKQFRAQLDRVGLRAPSAHLSMGAPDLGPVFADAHALGAHFTVSSALLIENLMGGAMPHGMPTKAQMAQLMSQMAAKLSHVNVDDFKKMAAQMNGIGHKAKQAGLQYAYHNHNFEFKALNGGVIGYDILLKESDPSVVDFELDCGWCVVSGHNPIEYFHQYPHRFKMLHVKDFKKGTKPTTTLMGGTPPQGTELGRGFIDYRPIFAAARPLGIDYYFVEQEPPFPDMPAIQAAKVDYEYLHSI